MWSMKNSTLQSFRFAAVIAAAFLAFSASAQTPPPTIKHMDKKFIVKAAKSGMAEVDISRVVAARSTNSDVRTLAQMMVDDHSKANEALTTLAASKGVTFPAKDMDLTDTWTKKNAKDLDADYLSKMVSDHKDAVSLFEKEAEKGEDADAKAFANDTLPKLQHHLAMVVNLQQMMK